MKEALDQAKRGRMYILDKMEEALPTPRANMSRVRAAYLHHEHSGG